MSARALVGELQEVLDREPLDLARAALIIAKVEHPDLDVERTLGRLAALGDRAAARLDRASSIRERIHRLNRLLFDDEGFRGNRAHYGDFRNSLLDAVVDRRLGIPITLALVFREVARAAGVEVFGVSFPGHFLLRVPEEAGRESPEALIVDPFDGGRILGIPDCEALLVQHLGPDARFTRSLLGACTSRQWLARLLANLKRIYVDTRSFPHARLTADLLVTVDPTAAAELRDRGLLAYQLEDYPAALRDLEQYLKHRTWRRDDRDEHRLVSEQVKTIRERVAGLN